MLLRNNLKSEKIVAFGEIFLLVSLSFALSFLIGESFGARVSAVPTIAPPPVANMPASATSWWNTGSYSAGPGANVQTGLSGGTGAGTSSVSGAGAGGGAGASTASATTTSTTATAPAAGGGILSNIFGGTAFGTGSTGAVIGGALFSGLVWGAIAFGAGKLIGNLLGLTDKQSTSVGLGLGAGAFVGSSLYLIGANSAAGTFTAGSFGAFATSGFGALLIGAGIAAAVIILTYKKEKTELVRFECLPWEAPLGGSRCEECNNDPLRPCSEYRCRSLGQGCQIVNLGSANEECVWISKGDTAAPHIEPDSSVLKPDGLKYDPDTTISPPNRGFRINDAEGIDACLPSYTKFTFGFTTDEPAQCKIDYSPSDSYDKMRNFYAGNSNLFLTKHVQQLKTMNTEAENGSIVPEIGVDGTYTFWVRCIDANGNGQDAAMVAFRYCVDKGPDETAPLVEGTSIQTGSPVQFNVDSVPIEVYTNEPSTCKWSRQDKDFNAMENEMDCSQETYQINANLDYTCSGSLTGVVNHQDNWFFFRCQDMHGNIMTRSHPLLLKGTQELTIKSTGPTGEFRGSTSVIPVTLNVETAFGAKDGKALCAFSTTPENAPSFVSMDNTNSFVHNQTLDLSAGSYIYYFKCIDEGGNLAIANTTFNVTVDLIAPSVTRVFKDSNLLKVITDEDAKCYYSTSDCNYEINGSLAMAYENPTKKNSHSVEWNDKVTYYIKCEDFNGNRPRPDSCQVIAKASDL